MCTQQLPVLYTKTAIAKCHMLRKGSELSIKNFYCVFVRTENNLIAFLGPSNCLKSQYAALSGTMHYTQVIIRCGEFTVCRGIL